MNNLSINSAPIVTIVYNKGYYKVACRKYPNIEQPISNTNYHKYEDALKVASKYMNDHSLLYISPSSYDFISICEYSKDDKVNYIAAKVHFSKTMSQIEGIYSFADLATAYIWSIQFANEKNLLFAPFWLLGEEYRAIRQ